MRNSYDYIIAGTGAAGLSLAVHLIRSGKFSDKKILLIDRELKTLNDHTWCFWEEGQGLFEEIIHKKWNRLWFHTAEFSRLMDTTPYEYKMIRAVDFYKYCYNLVAKHPNFTIRYGDIRSINNTIEGISLSLDCNIITADYAFNSILFEKPVLKKNEYFLLQHFKGWLVETNNAVFNPTEATLMDFRLPQEYGTSFVYVLPFTDNRALIEFTVFSKELLEASRYDNALKNYVENQLGIYEYRILEEEAGSIPMTNYRFPTHDGNVINIGTAGGYTKPSTGYTFRFIQKSSAAIVRQLATNGKASVPTSLFKKKYRFYDSTLLNILSHRKMEGAEIFSDMFRKSDPAKVLRFLDNESSLVDDLGIISSLPKGVFLKAALQQIF